MLQVRTWERLLILRWLERGTSLLHEVLLGPPMLVILKHEGF